MASIRWKCVSSHKPFECFIFLNFLCILTAIIKKCLENRGSYEQILNRTQIALLGRIVEMLEVFNTFTKYIQANSYPTLNSLVLFYVEIKQGLEKIHRDTMCEVIRKAVEILLANLDNRFPLKDECMTLQVNICQS